MKIRFIILIVLSLILFAGVSAQEKSVGEHNLDKLRGEIIRFQKLLSESSQKEKSILQNLDELNHNISLRQQY